MKIVENINSRVRTDTPKGRMNLNYPENLGMQRFLCHILIDLSLHIVAWYTVSYHGLINYIETKAKCRHPKNWHVKGLCGSCLSEFIDGDTVSQSLCEYVYSIHVYTNTLCKGGSDAPGLRQINSCRKVPLQVNLFRWRPFAVPSMSLIFLRSYSHCSK